MSIIQVAQPARQTPAAWTDLAPEIRRRLEREGIDGAAAWRALGRKRHQVFGIVPSVVRQLDALARGTRE